MKAVIFKNIEQSVIKEWESLWENSPYANYTNSPLWFLSVVESFHYKDFVIIAVYENEKLMAIGALFKRKKYGVEFYSVAPEDFVCGVPFLISADNSRVVAELTKQLLKLGNISFTNIPEEFLNELKKHTDKIDAIPQAPNYYLTVKKNSNGLPELSKRNKLMHQVRNISEKFTVRSFEDASSESLDKVYALDKKSSKQGKGYNAFDSHTVKEFYRSLKKHFKKYLLINIMYFEDKPIAYEIGFLIKNNYFGSQTAYNIDYRQYSPGKVIFVKLIDFLASKNVKMWDLGSGESLVKQLVTDQKRELYQVILGENAFIRNYSKNIEKLKIQAFDQSYKHANLYLVYRRVKKLISF